MRKDIWQQQNYHNKYKEVEKNRNCIYIKWWFSTKYVSRGPFSLASFFMSLKTLMLPCFPKRFYRFSLVDFLFVITTLKKMLLIATFLVMTIIIHGNNSFIKKKWMYFVYTLRHLHESFLANSLDGSGIFRCIEKKNVNIDGLIPKSHLFRAFFNRIPWHEKIHVC